MVAVVPLALDMYLPAIPMMAEFFGVEIVRVNATISAFLLGSAIGQLFGGAISDQVGRKPVGLLGLTLFVATSLVIPFSSSIGQVQALRVLQALGSGFGTVVCMPVIRDLYGAREAGRRMAWVIIVMMMAPIFAPVLGALLLPFGWQAIFLTLAAYAALIALLFGVGVPETRPGGWHALSLRSALPQFTQVLTHRVDGKLIGLRYILTSGFNVGVMMTFLTNASFLYIRYFDVSESRFPLLFACNIVAALGFNMLSAFLMKSINPQRTYKLGTILMVIATASLVALSGLVWTPSLAPIVVAIMISIGLTGLVTPNGTAMYMSYFKDVSGSAAALQMSSNFMMGALLGTISGLLFDGTPLPIALTMFGSATLAMLTALSIPAAEISDEA